MSATESKRAPPLSEEQCFPPGFGADSMSRRLVGGSFERVGRSLRLLRATDKWRRDRAVG